MLKRLNHLQLHQQTSNVPTNHAWVIWFEKVSSLPVVVSFKRESVCTSLTPDSGLSTYRVYNKC